MIPFLFAASLTCSDAKDIIEKIKPSQYDEEARAELIQVVAESTEKGCFEDAQVD